MTLLPTTTMAGALERIAFRMCMPHGYVKMGEPIRIWLLPEEVEAFEMAAVNLKVTKNISSVIQRDGAGHVLTVLPFGVHSLDDLAKSK